MLRSFCRPLPASQVLSQSTSLDSAQRHPQPESLGREDQQPYEGDQQPYSAEQAPVVAPHPMQSPFEQPDSSHGHNQQTTGGSQQLYQGDQLPHDQLPQAPAIAPLHMHSPFESPPSGLPKRHEGPAVTDYGHIGPTTSLVPTDAAISASSDLTPTYDSRTGSSSSQVRVCV